VLHLAANVASAVDFYGRAPRQRPRAPGGVFGRLKQRESRSLPVVVLGAVALLAEGTELA